MRKIKFINAKNESIDLTTVEPFLLLNFQNDTRVNIYSSKGMLQDGEIYLNNDLDTRDLTITLLIAADNRENLIKYKNKINRVFNPKIGQGQLIYTDAGIERTVDCIINKLPYFVNRNIMTAECIISLTASNPYFKNITETKKEIATWSGLFEFPLEILTDGIEIGMRQPSVIVNILNNGDVSCGIKIEFKALATVVNPSLYNINTHEFIRINKIMESGEIITVTTHFGNKKVESNKNGLISNAFNYIDFESTFLQLDTEDNLFRYDADEGLDNLNISIYYTPQYLGV